MKYGLGIILEVNKRPQIENLGVTDLTSFLSVVQILVVGNTFVVVDKQGKVIARDGTNCQHPDHKIRSIKQLVRRAVNNFNDSVGYLSLLSKADKGLLIEIVTNEDLTEESLKGEANEVDLVITKVDDDKAKLLVDLTKIDSPTLSHNSIKYWRNKKYKGLLSTPLKIGGGFVLLFALLSTSLAQTLILLLS